MEPDSAKCSTVIWVTGQNCNCASESEVIKTLAVYFPPFPGKAQWRHSTKRWQRHVRLHGVTTQTYTVLSINGLVASDVVLWPDVLRATTPWHRKGKGTGYTFRGIWYSKIGLTVMLWKGKKMLKYCTIHFPLILGFLAWKYMDYIWTTGFSINTDGAKFGTLISKNEIFGSFSRIVLWTQIINILKFEYRIILCSWFTTDTVAVRCSSAFRRDFRP